MNTNSPSEVTNHPYLEKKKISLMGGARINSMNEIMIPIVNQNHEIKTFQKIDINGNKRFMSFGKLEDSFSIINQEAKGSYLLIAEGFATGCSVATTFPDSKVVIAFSAYRLTRIASLMSRKYPECRIIICAEKDKSGVGEKKAKEAVSQTPLCIYVLPDFTKEEIESGATDFNDLFVSQGIGAVKKQINKAIQGFDEKDFEPDRFNCFRIERNGRTVIDHKRGTEYFASLNPYYTDENGRIWIFRNGFWSEISDNELKAFAENIYSDIDHPCLKKDAEEFLALIKRTNFKQKTDGFSIESYRYINFKNGVYDLHEKKLLPHSPDYGFKYIIPHDYNHEAKAPTFLKFLQVFTQGNESLMAILLEYIGFCISGFPYERFAKILIFYGQGANGKSTLIRGIQFVVGPDNCSSCELSSLPTNRFLSSHLANSLVNFSEEESPNVFTNTEQIKKLTGGSPLFAEKKGKDGYSFISNSKLVVSYNLLPNVGDLSFGFKRRLLIIPCNVNYEKNPELKIDNLDEKLKSEASGIINLCLEGLDRLLKNNAFTVSNDSEACAEELLQESDPFSYWWNNRIIVTENLDGDRIATRNLLDDFISFAGPKNRPNALQFGKMISKKIKELSQQRIVIRQGTMRLSSQISSANGVAGIRLNCL